MKQIETKLREIQELKSVIKTQKEHINREKKPSNWLDNVKDRLKDNENNLRKKEQEFWEFISKYQKNQQDKLQEWIDVHRQITENVKNFSKSKLPVLGQEYTPERIEIIDNIYEKWNNLLINKVLPDLYLAEDYFLFYDIRKAEKALNEQFTSIPNTEIKQLEKFRQQATQLHKELFVADTLLDKGEIWGASVKDIDNAQKSYSVIRKKIEQTETTLSELIEQFLAQKPSVIAKWQLLHQYTCICFVNEGYKKNAGGRLIDKVSIGLAKKAFYQWTDLKFENNKKFFIPNSFYLRTYDYYFNIVFENLRLT